MKAIYILFLSFLLNFCSINTSGKETILSSIKNMFSNRAAGASNSYFDILPDRPICFDCVKGLEEEKQILRSCANTVPEKNTKKLLIFSGNSRSGKTVLTFAFINALKGVTPYFKGLVPKVIIDKNNIAEFEKQINNLNTAVLVFDESCFFEKKSEKEPVVLKIANIFSDHIQKNPFKKLFCVIHLYSDEVGAALNTLKADTYHHIALKNQLKLV